MANPGRKAGGEAGHTSPVALRPGFAKNPQAGL